MGETTHLNKSQQNKKRGMQLYIFVLFLCFSPVISYIFFEMYPFYSGYGIVKMIATGILAIMLVPQAMSGNIKFSVVSFLYGLYLLNTIILNILITGNIGFLKGMLYGNDFLILLLLIFLDNARSMNDLFHKNIFNLIWVMFILAILVILYQEFIDPMFASGHMDRLIKREGIVGRDQWRNHSYFGLLGLEANGFTFVSLYGIILGHLVKTRKQIISFIVFGLGALFVFLTKTRWIMIYFLIVSSPIIISFSRLKIQYIIYFVITLVLVLGLLLFLSFPVEDVIKNRILDEDKGGITEGSFGARQHNYDVFFKHFSRTFWGGIYLSGVSQDYFDDLDRRIDADLIGVFHPISRYGILGSWPLYLFYMVLLYKLYVFYRLSGNITYFLIVLGFIVSAMSMGNFSLADFGLMIALSLYWSESKELNNKFKQTFKNQNQVSIIGNV
ncbi:MAG: hypothetical protein PHC50_01790 [Candidatus Cloacimonetes bacterium]|nr:hypothetical protein [Candidatus Cloacimonadota bacterium]